MSQLIKWMKLFLLLLLSTLGYVSGVCDDALGLESGLIKNNQITASDSFYGRYQPSTARLNNRYGWLTRSTTNYVQIDLLEYKNVTGLAIQGASNRLTKKIWLFYSLDGRVWETYRDRSGRQDIHVSATKSSQIIKINLDTSVQARYVAITPRTQTSGVRLEIYGCNSNLRERVPTIIENDIESNAVWTPSGSPYVIKSMVTIRPASQVSIQPGVKVIFEGIDAGLLIRGSLIASGIHGLPVCFWSTEVPNIAKTSWKGFTVESSGLFFCNFCELRHADVAVSGPTDSLSMNTTRLYQNSDGIHFTNGGAGTRTYNNLEITDNSDRGIVVTEGWLTRSRVVIKDSTFSNNVYAFLLKSPCDIDVVTCNISSSRYMGIRFDAGASLTVRGTRFKENNIDIQQYHSGNISIYVSRFEDSKTGMLLEKQGEVIVQRTTFKNHQDSGIKVYSRVVDLDISMSHFESNKMGIDMAVNSWREGHVLVSHSTFMHNVISGIDIASERVNVTLENNTFISSDKLPLSYPFGVALDNGWGHHPTYIVLKNNVVRQFAKKSRVTARRGNSGVSENIGVIIIGNVFESLSGPCALSINAEMVTVENNTFRNSTHDSTLIVSEFEIAIHRNIFENPNSQYDITTDALYIDNNFVDARYNYFGSTNKKYLRSRVNDVYQNLSRAEITIDPFYTSNLLEDLDSGTQEFSYDDLSDVGGVLQGDVLIPWNKRLTVTRTVVIPEGRTLTIESHVTMTFQKEQGIIVRGKLKLIGSESGPIMLTNGTELKWGGIMLTNSGLDFTYTRLQAAKTFSNIPSSNCTSNFSILLSHSVVEAGHLNLTSRRFNLSITDTEVNSPIQSFSFSSCESAPDASGSGLFVMKRAKLISNKFTVKVIDKDADTHDIQLSASEFIGAKELQNGTKYSSVVLDLGTHVHDETSLTENIFKGGNVEILANEALAKNIIIRTNVFDACQLGIGTPYVNMTLNIFENSQQHALKFTRESFKDHVVSAAYNYWGTEQILEIRAKVYDKTVNLNLPMIEVLPFFKNKEMTKLVRHVSFIGDNNTIGGNVDETVTLTRGHSPYTVISTIYVGKQQSLAINAGVQLLFRENTGIVVEGSFYVSGTADMPVLFHAATPGLAWEGVLLKGHEASIRLFGGNDEREGIVEIRAGTEYSTVCQKGFDSSAAQVVCRMAGFDPAGDIIVYTGQDAENRFGERSKLGDILYYDLACAGNESHLNDCKRNSRNNRDSDPECVECYDGQSSCYHSEDVGIRCLGDALQVSDSQSEIRLEHLEISDTNSGLTLGGNITKMSNIKSRFSRTNGITFNTAFLYGSYHELDNIDASFNTKDGIATDGMDKYRNFVINGCTLSNNGINGISITGQVAMSLNHCELSHNEVGLFSKDYKLMNISISETHITLNKKHAIVFDRKGYDTHELHLRILNSNISFHDTSHKYASWSSRVDYYNIITINGRYLKGGNLHLEGNVFQKNSGDLIVYNYNSVSKYFSTILKNNQFVNNTGNIIDISDDYDSKHLVSIVSNTFSGNRATSSRASMLRVFISQADSELIMTNNTLVDNKVSNLVDIQSYKVVQSNIDVSNNSIVGNQVEHVLSLNLYNVKIYRNTFTNPSAVCELKMPAFKPGMENNATMNYWGFENVSQIMHRICGFDIDMNLGFVTYLPSLLLNTSSSETVERHTDFFIHEALGGVIEEELSLGEENSSYVIQRSIMIRTGGKLILHGGTRLLFQKNRGIYSFGNVETLASSDRILLTNDKDVVWYGLEFNQTSDLYLSNLNISGSHHGVAVNVKHVVLSKCLIKNMETSGLTLREDVKSVDLKDSVVYNNKKHGVYINSYSIVIQNGMVHSNSESGLYFSGLSNSTLVQNLNIHDNKDYGIYLKPWTDHSQIRIANCHIHDHRGKHGLHIGFSIYSDGARNISVDNCTFESNPKGSVYIRDPHTDDNKIDIYLKANTFSDQGHVEVSSYGWSNVTLRENTFINSSSSTNCLVTVQFEKNKWDDSPSILNILSNKIRTTSGKCGFSLHAPRQPEGGLLYNELSQCQFSEGSILVDLANYTVSHNILDNPDSDFELNVLKTGNGFINASMNWWGTTNMQVIGERILDRSDDVSLLNVIYQPALEDRKFDCSLVKNCSGHGECVRPNGCECLFGWKGASCDTYDCSELSDCNEGTCIAPNKCLCDPGWIGSSCTVATCYGVNNCSERGFCTRPDTCTCLTQFRGDACEECAPNRWGPFCVACPRCLHGLCHKDTGRCVCDSQNWNGTLCDRCSRYFYGEYCLPITTVLSVSPDAGVDIGGTLVHIRGDNFNISKTSVYKCKFDTVIVDATRLSSHHFTCVSPKLSPRTVPVEISSDGKEFTNNKVQFTFVAECQETTCGSTDEPPRGQCVFGQCICTLPWTGPTCGIKIISPIVETVLDIRVFEGQVYRQQMTLSQGTNVMQWSLIKSPVGMVIDKDSGELFWIKAVGSTTPYVVSVRAENPAGHHDVVWFLTVPLSYSVIVDDLKPSGVLPYPSEIYITGHLNVTGLPEMNLTSPTVKVLVRNNGFTREFTTNTGSNTPPSFSLLFIPRPDDTGEFNVSANHPSDDQFVEQASWRIQNMVCQPRVVYLTEYLDKNTIIFKDVANLTNAGVDPLQSIFVEIESYPYNINSAKLRFVSSNASSLELLAPQGSETFDLTIVHDIPISTGLYIVFTSELGTRAPLRVQLELKVRQPVLQLSPRSIHKTVIKGKQTIFNVNVTNSGEAVAEDLQVDVSNDLNLEVASMSTSSATTSEKVDLNEGESATIVFVYTTPSEMPLGVVYGSHVIKAGATETLLKLTLYVTTDERYDIQVFVEDEYTYFAADRPLLADARITVKNPRRGIIDTVVTSETGTVLLKDLYADQYTLEAEADNHTSTSMVIVVDGTKSSFPVFLQRTAVTYTWTVTKTTFEDVYNVKLESTFETRVPMPVVTVEPAKVDLFPYTEGRLTMLEFLLTNHGYIRANNVRFSLPEHPSLRFIQLVESIGDIEANTSIVVPFKVEHKTIVKREAGAPCGLLVLYDYECGTVITGSVGVVLTSEPPGSPPSSCGRSRRVSLGRLSGRQGSTVFGYYSSTVVPCDCLKALTDSCIEPLLRLPFELVPGLGCFLDFYDMSKWDKSTSTVSGATTVASYFLDCGFGLTCPVCPYLFKALNCLDGLEAGCKRDTRRKREVNSELVLEVSKTRDYLNNYLSLSQELMGNLSVVDVKGKWKEAFFKGIAERSPLEYLFSKDEADNILEMVDITERSLIMEYLERWNNTFSAWKDGISLPAGTNAMSLERFKRLSDTFGANTKYAKERGFPSIFKLFDYTISEYEKSLKEQKKEEGICARVRIRISQDVVLTRDAFLARLEIDNGETAPLEAIKVDIFITKTLGGGSVDNHLFSIGKPVLEGISGVSGEGSIETGVEGSAEWLIVAYNGAAVGEDVDYDVGGTLFYTLEGREFTVPLLPDTITVSPNPSLSLAYFHEKYVQGNDPFTETIEKSVPFSLSVMVTNMGDGVARQVRITSGQPEIIENEKGLLVAFKIISAQLGSDPIQPSLTVDFGDLYRHQTKTARWFMTSSLKGRFYNYSATFENINPLGDPQLSVFQDVSYHDMVHLVRIDDSDADGLDDFLVNDVIDKDNLPDRLYDSSNGFNTYPVETVPPVGFTEEQKESTGSRSYTYVTVVVPQGSVNWRYSRIVNNVTRDVKSESLLQVTRDDEKDIPVPQNAWLTSHYDDNFYFHLFDKDKRENDQAVYTAVFGSKNLHQPSFTKESYSVETGGALASKDIVRVKATDLEGDDVSYKLGDNETVFTINENSGMIRNAVPIMDKGTFIFPVYAMDTGIPSLKATASVTVMVTSSATSDSNDTVSTPDTTKATEKTSSSGRPEYIPVMFGVSVVIYVILGEL